MPSLFRSTPRLRRRPAAIDAGGRTVEKGGQVYYSPIILQVSARVSAKNQARVKLWPHSVI